MLIRLLAACLTAGILALPGTAFATGPVVLSVHDNQFEPKQLVVPAGVKLQLVIRNLDALPVEFESTDLSREVIVRGRGEVKIYIGPMDPGTYHFFNDFNRKMQGTIVVKPAANKGN